MKYIILILLIWMTIDDKELNYNNPNNNTYELMDCQKIEIAKYESILNKYWTKSLERYKNDAEVIRLMKKSQSQWLKYRRAECSTVHQIWIDGTIRGLFHGQCLIDMTKQRTNLIWYTYLTYMDSTPAILPEPK